MSPSTALIDLIAGARPNFMKVAPIIRALEAHERAGGRLRYRLVHTGQHYDTAMSGSFFEQLEIPPPHVNLEVGSGSPAEQTGAIMVRYEALLRRRASDLCIVVGDVTSTMACAIVAQKAGVKVAHVEAGLRSCDRSMPEEINRLLTDAITDWFFTTSAGAGEILRRSGVPDERIHFVGNTMIDTLNRNLAHLRPPAFAAERGLEPKAYLVATLHRPSNVDDPEPLSALLSALAAGARGLPVVFPVHPRTLKTLNAIGSLPAGILAVDPQPYLEFNWLVRGARAVVTDSGGVTEEATVMGVPCLTLRTTTERPETVEIGTNELIGPAPAALQAALDRLFDEGWKEGAIPEKWDGKAGERIVAILDRLMATPA